MLGSRMKIRNLASTCSTWAFYCFLLFIISTVMKIEARSLSSGPQGNYQNNAAYRLLRQHQLAMAKTNSTTRKPEVSDQINCAEGGAKRYPDSKDESRFHTCTFSTVHRIWMVYSYNCPKQTVFNMASQTCTSKASGNQPIKRVPWDHRVQQTQLQKYNSQPQTNTKSRPAFNVTNNHSSSSVIKGSVKSSNYNGSNYISNVKNAATTVKIPLSQSQIQIQSQYYKNRFQNKVQKTTASPLSNRFPNSQHQYNRVRPGHVVQVNRRYPTTTSRIPLSSTPIRSISITTTVATTTTNTVPSTTEKPSTPVSETEVASSSMLDVSSLTLNSNENSTKSGTDAYDGKTTSNIGMIRTVAGKIAYLAQAIESLLTAFESSIDSKACVDIPLNSIGNSKVDAAVDTYVKDHSDESMTQLVPSDINILDFFTLNNPVNKEIVNKIITMPSTSSSSIPNRNPDPSTIAAPVYVPISIPAKSSTTNEQNDPEEKNDNADNTQQTATFVDSSSEEEEMNEEKAAVRLPSPSKEFDLDSPQSSSPIMEDTDAQAETTTSVHQVIGSENQIQQTEQNEKGGAEESMEPAEWNIIVKNPTETPLRTSTLNQIQLQDESSTVSTSSGPVIDDSSFPSLSSSSSMASSSADFIPSNEKTSNEKLFSLSAQDDTILPISTRLPGVLPLQSPLRADSSAVSNEQADILKTGSKGSNRRPRRQKHQKVIMGEETDFSLVR